MRLYRTNGTYLDKPLDSEFGWYLPSMVVDEATINIEQEVPSSSLKSSSEIQHHNNPEGCIKHTMVSQPCEEEFEEGSIDSEEELPDYTRRDKAHIDKLDFNIHEAVPIESSVHISDLEGLIESPETCFYNYVKRLQIPPKEKLMGLINPVNPETRALLSVVSYTKYARLNEKETTAEVLQTLNYKATNSKHLITETSPCGSPKQKECVPDISFQLSVDYEVDADKELISEIRNYHNTKEDNMLSLMLELVNTDLDSNLGDMSSLSNSSEELNDPHLTDTSDIGTSIHSSFISKGSHGLRFLDIPNRSNILRSIGLNDEIDRSIESFLLEKNELHQQMRDIKSSFEKNEKKLDSLLNDTKCFQNDLRETNYLTNLIHLLNGNLERVKDSKFPFRIFHKSSIEFGETEENLIL